MSQPVSIGDILQDFGKPKVCGICGQTFTTIVCQPCSDKRRAEVEAQERQAQEQRRRELWESICPPIYRDTDWSRITPRLRKIGQTWQPGQKHSLALAGDTGIGKTRAAFGILSRYFARKRSIFALHVGDAWDHSGDGIRGLSSAVYAQFSDDARIRAEAQAILARARKVSFLLLDDLGKERESNSGRLSETMAEALFSLLEARMIAGRTTILTSNLASRDFVSRFPVDKQKPLRRRLLECYEAPSI